METIRNIYVKHTKIPKKKLNDILKRDLWFDADRTRVLPSVHQERVDQELAKRAEKEHNKREKAKAKAGE